MSWSANSFVGKHHFHHGILSVPSGILALTRFMVVLAAVKTHGHCLTLLCAVTPDFPSFHAFLSSWTPTLSPGCLIKILPLVPNLISLGSFLRSSLK